MNSSFLCSVYIYIYIYSERERERNVLLVGENFLVNGVSQCKN